MLKEMFNNAVHKAWDLCVHTRIEMAVGAALFTIPAAIMSYQHEGTKLGQIPLAFHQAKFGRRKLQHAGTGHQRIQQGRDQRRGWPRMGQGFVHFAAEVLQCHWQQAALQVHQGG